MQYDKLLISAEAVPVALDDPDTRILDCRFDLADPDAGRRAWLEAHIPGAAYADLDRDLAAPVVPGTGRHPLPRQREFAAAMQRLGISNSSRVIVYDQADGALAARAWWLLRWAGHDDVRLLDGGFDRWLAQGQPVESGERPVASGRFRVTTRPGRILTTEEIVAVENIASLRLVDARDGARYRGEREPLDKVAGHIPGAINVPFVSSLAGDGRWKSPEALRQLWAEALGDAAGQPWSVMCGSGVTACHLAVSGLLAGLPEPRVYVGSWSEWIEDPGRPIAVGER